jgi:hypothetical protein
LLLLLLCKAASKSIAADVDDGLMPSVMPGLIIWQSGMAAIPHCLPPHHLPTQPHLLLLLLLLLLLPHLPPLWCLCEPCHMLLLRPPGQVLTGPA